MGLSGPIVQHGRLATGGLEAQDTAQEPRGDATPVSQHSPLLVVPGGTLATGLPNLVQLQRAPTTRRGPRRRHHAPPSPGPPACLLFKTVVRYT